VDIIVQPDDGLAPLLGAISGAQKALDVIIFRLDLKEIEKALEAAVARGVTVRALIAHTHKGPEGLRLHVRAMIRDGDTVFVGSQSLRALELDARREVGLIVRDSAVVKRLQETFEEDWAKTDLGKKEQKEFEKDQKLAAAKEVAAVAHDR
jgi:phosphatidylserine/phosphatidylglycerophosphate/cardiolipin synthase-like enzyme